MSDFTAHDIGCLLIGGFLTGYIIAGYILSLIHI